MAGVPTYPAGGTVRAAPRQANTATAANFGGQTAEALAQVGNAAQQLGARMGQIEKEEKAKQDATDVTAAYMKAQERLRGVLYDPEKGLYNAKGSQAVGLRQRIDAESRKVFDDVLSSLADDEQKNAFDGMWARNHQATVQTAEEYEFKEAQQYRLDTKTAALEALQNEAAANYQSPALLLANVDAAKAIVRANADGMPPEAVANLERETVSAMHVAVIKRMAADEPGDALDYYESIRDQVSGADHGVVEQVVGGVAQARRAKSAVAEIVGNAAAVQVVDQVYGMDDEAAPPIAIDPGIAQQVARTLGIPELEGLDEKEVASWMASPEGRETSKRVSAAYIGQQLARFDDDLEAALVAATTSPDDATAWLNAGRDYSVLPEGAFEQVGSIVQRYTGLGIGENSAGIQAALSGEAQGRYDGDAGAFLAERFNPMTAGETLDALPPELESRLAAFISEAPPGVQDYLQVIRGDASGAELGWMGGSFAEAPPEVIGWVYVNAERFGLNFPDGIAPWRIETVEGRGGGEAGDEMVGDTFAALGLPVALQPQTASAADLYGRPTGPFKLKGNQGDVGTWERLAQERYGDNPPLLGEVTRQLNNEWNQRADTAKAEISQAKRDAFQLIMQGVAVNDMDPITLQELGPEAVGQLLTLEGKFAKGSKDETDATTYYELTTMSSEEFEAVDLMDYADRLSLSDFKEMANKQAVLQRGGDDKPGVIAGQRTRTQIMSDTEAMLGWEPTKKKDDAEAAALLNRRLDERIAAWSIENDGKSPGSLDIQKMVDDLLIEGKAKLGGDWWAVEHRAFELMPEELGMFTVADTFDQIPLEAHDVVATGYRALYGDDPNEAGALDFYNDMTAVMLGGAPMPPDGISAEIARGLAQQLKRAPRDNEIAATYRWMIENAAGLK